MKTRKPKNEAKDILKLICKEYVTIDNKGQLKSTYNNKQQAKQRLLEHPEEKGYIFKTYEFTPINIKTN